MSLLSSLSARFSVLPLLERFKNELNNGRQRLSSQAKRAAYDQRLYDKGLIGLNDPARYVPTPKVLELEVTPTQPEVANIPAETAVETPLPEVAPTEATEVLGLTLVEAAVDYNSLTKDQLLTLAAERKVKVAKSWVKAKIIEALNAPVAA